MDKKTLMILAAVVAAGGVWWWYRRSAQAAVPTYQPTPAEATRLTSLAQALAVPRGQRSATMIDLVANTGGGHF